MKVSQSKYSTLSSTIDYWLKNGDIDSQTADRLKSSMTPAPFDWKRLAKYSFWISIICVIISLTSIVADDYLREIFTELFSAPPIVKAAFFLVISTLILFWSKRLQFHSPGRVFRNEALLFVGVILISVSIAFLGEALDSGSGHFSILILLASIVYGVIGVGFKSELVWIFSLLTFCGWLGAETGYLSGWGSYYLGMNYPMRFILLGVVMVLVTLAFKKVPWLDLFTQATRVVGLLNLFIALWILSIFGNYSSLHEWQLVKQFELIHWALLFGVVAIGAIYHGLRYDDGMTRGFGIVFLFLNLYTRFFEYLWDSTHKALFFALLAVSFWIVGSKAEKIWTLGKLPTKEPKV